MAIDHLLTGSETAEFAREWADAWNAHDLDRILAHWADDCIFTSPRVREVTGRTSSVVRGKAALREYWSKALAAAPSLHFELQSVFTGADSIVIRYRNHRGQDCSEWLRLGAAGELVEGAAHYAPGSEVR